MSVRLLKGHFTVDDYYRLAELGILGEDDRVELLDGQVVPMTPIGSRHAACVNRLTRLLSRVVGDFAMLSIQNPLRLGEHSEPQPDVAVLKHRADGYAAKHPGPENVLLLIEVADTSEDYDREVKIPLYAQAGIVEAWIVRLDTDSIEVYREPRSGSYQEVRTLKRGDSVTLPYPSGAAPILIDDVLGP